MSSLPQQQPWTTGIFDCTKDLSNCCLTCWCPCITFGRIAEIVDEGVTSCRVGGLLYGVVLYFTGCACCYSCTYRTKLRAKFNLAESPCGDFTTHSCCELCALCQEYRELKHRGLDPALGWAENMQRQQNSNGNGNGNVGMTAPAAQTMGK